MINKNQIINNFKLKIKKKILIVYTVLKKISSFSLLLIKKAILFLKNFINFIKIFFSFCLFCLKKIVFFIIKISLIPIFFILAYVSRFFNKKYDIGLGPEPLINNIYHKKALKLYGYTVQTFVSYTWFITQEFDLILKNKLGWAKKNSILHYSISFLFLFIYSLFNYRCIYIYFNGGPLVFVTPMYAKIEPLIYKTAKIKIVVMPYGSDILDLNKANLFLTHCLSQDYPDFFKKNRIKIRNQIDLWTQKADHIISGCDWVDYLHYWDTLTLAHFSIDTNKWQLSFDKKDDENKTLTILHAPNHRWLKGTKFFIKAIEELKNEGYPVELKIFEKKHNSFIKKQIEEADIVADQLVIGWYAMFALESMSLCKPVLCYLREDLLNLYELSGLIEKNEIPIINCNINNIKEKIKELTKNRNKLKEIGKKSREFVIKHHSLETVGKRFDEINKKIGIFPSKINKKANTCAASLEL